MNEDPSNQICRDPFEDTLAAIINGEATERDRKILNDTLRCDPEARRLYIRTMAFEGMLAREFAPLEEKEMPVAKPRGRWIMPTAVAASILLGAATAWHFLPTPSQAVVENPIDPENEITHAVITTMDEASGSMGGSALTAGMRLSRGTLELDSGLVGITFDTGAEITLEGPASLQLESENKTRLTSGRATTYCPEQARGFVMLTPTSYIRDLGDAFSVDVRNSDETDLHVLEGEVEVATTGRNGAKPRIIRQREAVRLAAGGIQTISFRPDHPGDHKERHAAKIPPSIHWSFDEWNGNSTWDSSHQQILTVGKGSRKSTPERVEGPFGTALRFDGTSIYAKSDYPGVGGSQARTVACWVRVQADSEVSPRSPGGIVAWGLVRPNESWQLAWNHDDRQGILGAPRVEFGDGYAIASTDLRDGQWHHLAVVCLSGPNANVATHVRIYLDGRLEPLSGRRQRPIETDTTSMDAKPLTLGRHLGKNGGLFDGDLDEVYIFEGPLLPNQIMKLMKKNSPGSPKPMANDSRN